MQASPLSTPLTPTPINQADEANISPRQALPHTRRWSRGSDSPEAIHAAIMSPMRSSFNSADIRHKIFIFVNPNSGGNKASAFTRSAVRQLILDTPYLCDVYMYDIREGPPGSKPGFNVLKEVVENHKKSLLDADVDSQIDKYVRVLVAGGDGTVMWCTEEMQRTGVDDSACAIGIVPYGTGNDFANAYGWKHFYALEPFDTSLATLRRLINVWIGAKVVTHDLWNVFITINPGGYFTKINSQSRKKEVLLDSNGAVAESLSFIMSNYFSTGIESRIGRGFDRHRTQSQMLNKMRYGLEGLKKTMFKKTLRINDTIDTLVAASGTPEEETIFNTAKDDTHVSLKKAASLVALNIPSFCGGNDIWSHSKKAGTSTDDKEEKTKIEDVLHSPQVTGDKQLEFMTFASVASMGLEFLLKGRGSRIHKGPGPWKLKFKELSLEEPVYFQVDGEFFQAVKPNFLTIKHDRCINVLKLE